MPVSIIEERLCLVPGLGFAPRRFRSINRVIKRSVDVVIASLLLLILSPLFLLIAGISRLCFGSGILFVQERAGYGGKPFNLYKFRSMHHQPRSSRLLLSDDERLTRWGRILRALSLDELPQLINIIKGEMSLVGPRPQTLENLTQCSEIHWRRHSVLPGLTGLAQVKGRTNLSWRRRFRYDLFYVDNWSLGLDVVILLKTVLVVFSGLEGGLIFGRDGDVRGPEGYWYPSTRTLRPLRQTFVDTPR